MILHIKNMVCNRCKMVVKQELEKLGQRPVSVELGVVEFDHAPGPADMSAIKNMLESLGFELIGDKNALLIEQIKALLIQLVNTPEQLEKEKLSTILARHFHKDYSGLSKFFSAVEGISIEQYFILQKVEKVKELLVYGEKTTSEIAWELGYSSVAHLSRQFKKITGITPGAFRSLRHPNRKSIDQL